MGQRNSKRKKDTSGEQAGTSGDQQQHGDKRLVILHFNDVYNIMNNDDHPVSGAARLAGLLEKEKAASDVEPLVLFSGDAFSPSTMSCVTLGAHMPPVLCTMGIHAACIGNHDFDLGLSTCQSLVQQCNFPWMMSNVRDKETGDILGGLHETLMLEHAGVKVGLMGLVEPEWLDTLAALDPETMAYTDFVQKGEELAGKLRAEGAELVVALTHMREPNDRQLAKSVAGIDLVLGGHDHHYAVEPIEPHGTYMVKSGTDFRELTRINLTLPAASQDSSRSKPQVTWQRIEITKDAPEHPPTAEVVGQYAETLGSKLEEVVGHAACDMDARFTTIRRQESNMGNLVCDILRATTGAQIVIMNSGTLRSDQVHQAGPVCVKDIIELLPMPDSMVLLEATGSQVVKALENGVSQVPRLEGRFPQVSGIRFQYDSSKPANSRVLKDSVYVLQQEAVLPPNSARHPSLCTAYTDKWLPLQPEATYRLCVKAYMATGKDGYDVLEQCKVLVDEEDGPVVSQVLRNHFRSLAVLNLWDPKVKASAAAKKWKEAAHQGRIDQSGAHEDHSACEAAGTLEANKQASLQRASTHVPDGVTGELPAGQEARKGSSVAGQGSQQLEGSDPGTHKMFRSMPTRTRLGSGDTGPCVLTLEHGYAVKPVVEGRIIDVAKASSHADPAPAKQ